MRRWWRRTAGAGAHRELGVAALLAAAVLGAFFDIVSLRRALFYFDISEQIGPLRFLFSEALRVGELPLWSDGMLSGFPVFAEGQGGALYPLNLVFYPFLTFWQALNLTFVLLELVAAVGCYALLRAHTGRVAAATGGLVFALSGAMLTHHFHIPILSTMALLPLCLALLEHFLRRPSPGGSLALILCWAAIHFAGHSQSAVLIAFSSFVYTLCRHQGERGGRALVRRLGLVAAIMLGGVLVAAVQLLPTFELAGLSVRGGPLAPAARVASSYPPWLLWALFFPHAFGSRGLDTVVGVGPGLFHEMFNFVGVCTPVLAAFAWRSERRDAVRLFAVLAAAGLVLAFGEYAYVFEPVTALPGLSRFRVPARLNVIVALALGGLVALGLDALVDGIGNGRARFRRWWLAPALIAAGVYGLAFALYFCREPIRQRLLGDLAASPFVAEVTEDLWLRGRLLAVAILIIAIAVWRRLPWLAAGLAVVVAIDMMVFGHGFLPTVAPSYWEDIPESVRIIRGLDPSARIAAKGCTPAYRPRGWQRPARADSFAYALGQLNHSIPLFFGLKSVTGHSPLRLRHYTRFLRGRSARDAGARFWVACEEAPADHHLLGQSREVRVYEVPDPIPRAYLAAVSPNGTRRKVRLSPRPEVLPPACAGDERVSITRAENERVEIAVEAACPGFLVLRDPQYPGWRATVDGDPVPILLADGVFRAVRVGPGAHQVSFVLASTTFRMGLGVSLASLVCALAIPVGVGLRRRWRLAKTR